MCRGDVRDVMNETIIGSEKWRDGKTAPPLKRRPLEGRKMGSKY